MALNSAGSLILRRRKSISTARLPKYVVWKTRRPSQENPCSPDLLWI